MSRLFFTGRRAGGRKEGVKRQLALGNGKVLATEARGSELYVQHPCKKPVCRDILINPAQEGRDRKRPGARSHSSPGGRPCLNKQGRQFLRNNTESDHATSTHARVHAHACTHTEQVCGLEQKLPSA